MCRLLTVGLLALLLYAPATGAPSLKGQISQVAISPDGKLVAVVFRKGSTSFIYKIDVGTGTAARLTAIKAGTESDPAFSADGKRIAFTYRTRSEERRVGKECRYRW